MPRNDEQIPYEDRPKSGRFQSGGDSPGLSGRQRRQWSLFHREEYAKRVFGEARYSLSPYANPRHPERKPYHEMTRMEQRIYKKMRLAAILGALAGLGAGALLLMLLRSL